MAERPHIAYLFSRYPVVSQTFCDSEMLALESMGVSLTAASINPPPNAFRHRRLASLNAEAHYPPPPELLKALPVEDKANWEKLGELVARHNTAYGSSFKAGTRARNALWLGRLFERLGVDHVHVHFANRATHTALFLKKLGFPFSFTAHAQDFMVDLGSDELLAEMCRESEFVIAVSDFSKRLLQEKCPDSAGRIHRVYNGIDPDTFPAAEPEADRVFRIVSVGRLIEFKGFHHLVDACARLKERGIDASCTIIGDGPWRERLQQQAAASGNVRFVGVLGQEAVKAELARGNVFCLPSIVDSKGASDILPTVIMEAMAVRLPVVSTKLVGIPEMVDDGVTGTLVEPGDSEALAEALAALAGDAAKACAFGEAGHVRADELFSLRTTAAQLKGHFDAALAGKRLREKPSPAAVLYYLDAWPGRPGDLLGEEVPLAAQRDDFACVAADGSDPSGTVEYFPDGVVLEADWRSYPDDAERLEELRNQLGTSVSGEAFFRDARRALHLSLLMRKRGLAHLHAARANGLLCGWLVKQLSGCTLSTAVEDKPPVSRALLAKLLPECGLASVSDDKLAKKLGGTEDALGLRIPPSHRKLGPIKVRRGETEEEREARRHRAIAWLERVASP